MELTSNAEPKQQLRTEEPRPAPTGKSGRFSRIFSAILNVLPLAAFLILTMAVVDSAYRARRDPGNLAFVLLSYADLTGLYWCLRRFENLRRDGEPEERRRLKITIWTLATVLNFAFAWRVAAIMPVVLAVIVWCMAGFVAIAGFYALFLLRDQGAADDDGTRFGPKKSGSKEYRYAELSPEEKV